MKHLKAIFFVLATCSIIGCGDAQPTNVVDSSDQDAIAAYQAAEAAQDAAMDADPDDADDE